MLTQVQLKSYQSRNELIAALNKGEFTIKELKSAYSTMRKNVISQVKRINKSDIPFLKGETPYPRKVRNLVTTADIINEVTDTLKFVNSKRYTMREREATRAKTIRTLNRRGIDIGKGDYLKWIEFITWFRHSEYSALYDSTSDIVFDVFEEGANSRDWAKLFKEWDGQYD